MVLVDLLVTEHCPFEDEAIHLVGSESRELGLRVWLMIREVGVPERAAPDGCAGSLTIRVDGRAVDLAVSGLAARERVRAALMAAASLDDPAGGERPRPDPADVDAMAGDRERRLRPVGGHPGVAVLEGDPVGALRDTDVQMPRGVGGVDPVERVVADAEERDVKRMPAQQPARS
jgi:hypothetical protein